MFDALTDKLGAAFKRLRGYGTISESNINDALRDVRLALLDADVHVTVVREFLGKVREKALGRDVLDAVSPAQQFVKIVHDELAEILGSRTSELNLGGRTPVVMMLVGLQGSGKTTHAAKLALHLKHKKRKPALVSLDVYRPAAYEQLKRLAAQIDVPFYQFEQGIKPVDIARQSVIFAEREGIDTLIWDTAGRLHIDEALMDELKALRSAFPVSEVLLVVDAMIGQESLNVASSFNDAVNLTGLVMTKLDGDARGGAAMSAKFITGVPIKFVGVGEKVNALELFHPDRMASRILGMGDVVSLVEKAQEVVDLDQAEAMQKKLLKGSFTLEDFRQQFSYIKKLGSFESIMGFMPGMSKLKGQVEWDKVEREFKRMEAIISSMTAKERRNPDIINGSRRKRIATGSGTSVQEVNGVLNNYLQARKLFQQVKQKGARNVMRGLGNSFRR